MEQLKRMKVKEGFNEEVTMGKSKRLKPYDRV
jgi:hypothetical protein